MVWYGMSMDAGTSGIWGLLPHASEALRPPQHKLACERETWVVAALLLNRSLLSEVKNRGSSFCCPGPKKSQRTGFGICWASAQEKKHQQCNFRGLSLYLQSASAVVAGVSKAADSESR